MPQMGVAATAADFGANHAVTGIAVLIDLLLISRLVEARPTTTGVILGIGSKQLFATALT